MRCQTDLKLLPNLHLTTFCYGEVRFYTLLKATVSWLSWRILSLIKHLHLPSSLTMELHHLIQRMSNGNDEISSVLDDDCSHRFLILLLIEQAHSCTATRSLWSYLLEFLKLRLQLQTTQRGPSFLLIRISSTNAIHSWSSRTCDVHSWRLESLSSSSSPLFITDATQIPLSPRSEQKLNKIQFNSIEMIWIEFIRIEFSWSE